MKEAENSKTSSKVWVGEVCRVLEDGYGFVQPEGSNERYVFALNTIPDYHGQTAKELNLKPGSKVVFEVEDQKVVSLRINS
ncbi:hypothetical protein C7H19_14300 [Aphanothece hegewaldii CCALA 016]|uniref:Cold-shock protein n=1 Tax=Aphanothece hegewaldii CCALA 016 TaxID=2107694 RepID=A0A2T1LW79_9CHRO|nr:hypothetical protein [Aphanothece hegewaldii]PSF36164.1 hypothetical protein C7H19_14300 [Aphanothece hegewaldii CCALA 016]